MSPFGDTITSPMSGFADTLDRAERRTLPDGGVNVFIRPADKKAPHQEGLDSLNVSLSRAAYAHCGKYASTGCPRPSFPGARS